MRRGAALRIGALTLVAGCFLISAAFRLIVAAPALAQQLAPGASGQPQHSGGPETDALLEAVRERGAQLDKREREIAERFALLELAEKEIEKNRAALLEAEDKLAATMALADTAAEQDLARLTAIYENVKPKRAAEIFQSMDTSFAAGILAMMSPDQAGDILTLVDADTAYAISVLMAARNMNAGGLAPGD